MLNNLTKDDLGLWLQYHFQLARLINTSYPDFGTEMINLSRLHQQLFEASGYGDRFEVDDWSSDVVEVTSEEENDTPLTYCPNSPAWERLRILFTEHPHLFVEHDIASQEEVHELRNMMRFPA
jgi:hypothetical protein